MKMFSCDGCGALVFFENVTCIRCGHSLGFLPDLLDLSTLAPSGGTRFRPLKASAQDREYKQCANAIVHQVCNWMIPTEEPDAFCRACRLNEIIPDLSYPENRVHWHKLEIAKRRVIYMLLRLGLNPGAGSNPDEVPLRFRFLADTPGNPVLTGHGGGVITINVAEADDAERERRRVALHEPFRTLPGHLRHEIAHYYWDYLVLRSPHLQRFRELFGDERLDYPAALKVHYENGPALDWQERCVTAYASSHPWEDWAETWAHYLHIIDTIETAGSFGLSVRPRHPESPAVSAEPEAVAGLDSDFEAILQHWLPLTFALNELNRGMGLPDLYPFVLSSTAVSKLRFVHDVLRGQREKKIKTAPGVVIAI